MVLLILIDELVYDGNDLGAVYTKEKTTFRIWTPAAGKVSLNLYEQGDGDNLIETIPMTADVKGPGCVKRQET